MANDLLLQVKSPRTDAEPDSLFAAAWQVIGHDHRSGWLRGFHRRRPGRAAPTGRGRHITW